MTFNNDNNNNDDNANGFNRKEMRRHSLPDTLRSDEKRTFGNDALEERYFVCAFAAFLFISCASSHGNLSSISASGSDGTFGHRAGS